MVTSPIINPFDSKNPTKSYGWVISPRGIIKKADKLSMTIRGKPKAKKYFQFENANSQELLNWFIWQL